MLCGSLRCAGFSEYGSHPVVSLQLFFPCSTTGQDGSEMVSDILDVHLMGNKLGNYLFACNEIDE